MAQWAGRRAWGHSSTPVTLDQHSVESQRLNKSSLLNRNAFLQRILSRSVLAPSPSLINEAITGRTAKEAVQGPQRQARVSSKMTVCSPTPGCGSWLVEQKETHYLQSKKITIENELPAVKIDSLNCTVGPWSWKFLASRVPLGILFLKIVRTELPIAKSMSLYDYWALKIRNKRCHACKMHNGFQRQYEENRNLYDYMLKGNCFKHTVVMCRLSLFAFECGY